MSEHVPVRVEEANSTWVQRVELKRRDLGMAHAFYTIGHGKRPLAEFEATRAHRAAFRDQSRCRIICGRTE